MDLPEEEFIKAANQELRKRQIFRAGPKPIESVVSDLLTRRGYARMQAENQYEELWLKAAGSKLSKDSRVGNYRGGMLEVFVRNSAVLQELTFQKRRILKKLAGLSPQQNIKELRFRVGAID